MWKKRLVVLDEDAVEELREVDPPDDLAAWDEPPGPEAMAWARSIWAEFDSDSDSDADADARPGAVS